MRQLRDTANPGYMDAPAIRVEDMDLPVIRVENWGEDPPLAVKYICGENELDFMAVYAKIKHLLHHPGRGRLELHKGADGRRLQLKECDKKFLEAFWDCVANLLDYFADFIVTDTVLMQSVWYHMLDVLQEAAVLPHNFWHPQLPKCSHSQQFARDYEQTLDIINTIITTQDLRPIDALVHSNRGRMDPESSYAGAFKAGLKPWQQFLYGGSPGFEVPVAERVYSQDAQHTADSIASERSVPMTLRAIIRRHTERARDLAAKIAQTELDGSSGADLLADFDQHSLHFEKPMTCTSTDGQKLFVQQMYPDPQSRNAPRTYPGREDPSSIIQNPSLYLLDEHIGEYKGLEALSHPGGNDKFHMLTIQSSSVQDTTPSIESKEPLKMFDDWTCNEYEGLDATSSA